MDATNPYCEGLGIRVPRLRDLRDHREANNYSLLIVALLEHGGPLTLAGAAERFEKAGVAPARRALASLKKCKPARAPIYRDGDEYALDPHSDEADLWSFRLGLRPPRGSRTVEAPADPKPLPSPDERIRAEDLAEAWSHGIPSGWSDQRIVACVLEAHGRAMPPADIIAFVDEHASTDPYYRNPLSRSASRQWPRNAPIRSRDDGKWELDASHPAIRSARKALRDRLEQLRCFPPRPDPEEIQAQMREMEARREVRGMEMAGLRRVVIQAFPPRSPAAVVLLDVGRREIRFFEGRDLDVVGEELERYDVLAGLEIRPLLRAVRFDPGHRWLADLGPPQKSRRLNRWGRTLKITTNLLIRGSCSLSRPLGDPRRMRRYLRERNRTRLRRRLEADAKSLFALYQYGRLHRAVRLRWGFLDEMIPAPWVHRDESTVRSLLGRAHRMGCPLEVVTGTAPGWKDPWARVRQVEVRKERFGWQWWLVDDEGETVDPREIQLARLSEETRRTV